MGCHCDCFDVGYPVTGAIVCPAGAHANANTNPEADAGTNTKADANTKAGANTNTETDANTKAGTDTV